MIPQAGPREEAFISAKQQLQGEGAEEKALQRSLQANIPEEELNRVFEELKDYEQ